MGNGEEANTVYSLRKLRAWKCGRIGGNGEDINARVTYVMYCRSMLCTLHLALLPSFAASFMVVYGIEPEWGRNIRKEHRFFFF